MKRPPKYGRQFAKLAHNGTINRIMLATLIVGFTAGLMEWIASRNIEQAAGTSWLMMLAIGIPVTISAVKNA